MRTVIVVAVVLGCSGGGSKPTTVNPPTIIADAAATPAPVIDAAAPVDASPPDAETVAIDVSQCPTAPVDGVAKGMAYDCGAFSVRDVTSPEHVPLADLIASVTQKSEAAGAQVHPNAVDIPGADDATVLGHADGDQVSIDVIAVHDAGPHLTRIVLCTAPWMDHGEAASRRDACIAAVAARLTQPGFPARKVSKKCTQAAAHFHDLLADSPAPGPESELLTITADFLINCTDPLAKCVIKATTPDAIIACWAKTVPRSSP